MKNRYKIIKKMYQNNYFLFNDEFKSELDLLFLKNKKSFKNLKPILFYEHQKEHRKSDAKLIKEYLKSFNYTSFKEINNNTIAIHKDLKI